MIDMKKLLDCCHYYSGLGMDSETILYEAYEALEEAKEIMQANSDAQDKYNQTPNEDEWLSKYFPKKAEVK